jgi:hypothetical protein
MCVQPNDQDWKCLTIPILFPDNSFLRELIAQPAKFKKDSTHLIYDPRTPEPGQHSYKWAPVQSVWNSLVYYLDNKKEEKK